MAGFAPVLRGCSQPLAVPYWMFCVRFAFWLVAVPFRAGSHCLRRVCIKLSGPGPDRRLPAVRELVGVGGVVASLSVTSDLTRGHPPGEAMRACLATELARRAGLDLVRQSEVYYGTLLRFVGCAATSHEIAAALGGDDVAVRAAGDLIDPTVPGQAQRFLAGLA